MVWEITIFLSSSVKSQIIIPKKCKTSVKDGIIGPILLKMNKNGMKNEIACLKLSEKTENVAHFVKFWIKSIKICLKLTEKTQNVAHFR